MDCNLLNLNYHVRFGHPDNDPETYHQKNAIFLKSGKKENPDRSIKQTYVNLCQPLSTFVNLCQPLSTFDSLCQPLTTLQTVIFYDLFEKGRTTNSRKTFAPYFFLCDVIRSDNGNGLAKFEKDSHLRGQFHQNFTYAFFI